MVKKKTKQQHRLRSVIGDYGVHGKTPRALDVPPPMLLTWSTHWPCVWGGLEKIRGQRLWGMGGRRDMSGSSVLPSRVKSSSGRVRKRRGSAGEGWDCWREGQCCRPHRRCLTCNCGSCYWTAPVPYCSVSIYVYSVCVHGRKGRSLSQKSRSKKGKGAASKWGEMGDGDGGNGGVRRMRGEMVETPQELRKKGGSKMPLFLLSSSPFPLSSLPSPQLIYCPQYTSSTLKVAVPCHWSPFSSSFFLLSFTPSGPN